MNKKVLYVLIAVVITAVAFGCAKKNVKVLLTEPEYKQKIDTLFNQRKYDDFREEAQYYLSDFPGSPECPKVQFMIGESFFNKKKYEEAIAAYQRLIDKYTASDYVDDAYFKIGRSYYARKSHAERDQEATKKAMYYFEKVIRMDSPFKTEAESLMKDCRYTLALKEYYIARFYLKTGHYDVSLQIIEKAMREYDDTGVAPMMNYMKAYNYYKKGDKDKALAVLRSVDTDSIDMKLRKKVQKLGEKIRKMK